MYCFVSCQSNCGHVAPTSLWARYLSFSALICPNYLGFFTTITHKVPNCFLRDASPPWNHQYALSLREKLSICYHIITSSSHEKAAAAVFSKISHHVQGYGEVDVLFFFVVAVLVCFFLWDNLLKEDWVLRRFPNIQHVNQAHIMFSVMESHRAFFLILAFHEVICNFYCLVLN